MIKIHTLGGYDEIGKNMTAVEIDNEIIVLDMGLYLDNYIKAQDNDPFNNPTAEELRIAKAIPDDSSINKSKVVAIIPSHAHLDHLGAIPYLEKNYNADIVCTPFTKALLKIIAKDKHIDLKNKIKAKMKFKTKHTTIEFIPITHSTLQTIIVAIHTSEGTILYANDFKVDMTPTFGEKPDLNRLKNLKTLALICDCIYAKEDEHTPSESEAKDKLETLFKTHNFDKKAIIISTFSSHLARLQTIIKCAKQINRKIIFLGRSLAKYIEAAENILDLPEDIEIVKYKKEIKRRLKEINKAEYVIVATGHQGEPNAVLSRIANNQLSFELEKDDVIIFSSSVIPVEENEKNSEILINQLKDKQVKIFKDVHVSGHAAGKDLKEFIKLTNPKHIFPAHGPYENQQHLIKIAKGLDYSDEFLHCCHDGETTTIN
ncbi:ribonuclease J [Candidatus Woesearchaeota archaeon CG10_big_fil_rev_8_21_14_0_10_34_8]|nr:MAG: ribonuclease J [Candidatus Woesearchaeota archaeon CG10_big_fil_rev_8_21_14_0_10_34_8]